MRGRDLYVCERVFEEKHISLLLLPPSLFFLPADLHSRWVGLFLLRFALSLVPRALSLFQSAFVSRSRLLCPPASHPRSPVFPSSPFRRTGKIQPRTARCSLFTRASPREIARRAQRRARTPGGNGAHLLSALSFLLLRSDSHRSFSLCDRAAIAARSLTQQRCTTIITTRLR